mgnify:CR=1 FL=1
MSQQGARDVHDPLLGLDIERLEREMESYEEWLDERTEEAYKIAEKARAKGLDHSLEVEIPRASDLASRTEKLLVEVGDIVKKGQNIALVGATGRSTGPQVHFEVYKNGRVVDPSTYIHRTVR